MLSRRCLGLIPAAFLLARVPAAAAEDFDSWLAAFRRDARKAGISEKTLAAALDGVRPIDRVVELDRKQPEGRMSFAEYRSKVVSDARIERGRRLRVEHAAELERVRDRYGVSPEVIVALWGVESNFGDIRGRFQVVDSLATLAWEGRRAKFFRRELLAALRILDDGDVTPAHMYGSWAGAMGQCQFMPTTFLHYAVDADGDGRRDIWDSLPDVFASIANYLVEAGWKVGQRWGREVELPADGTRLRKGLDHKAPLERWAEVGVRTADGEPLPGGSMYASLVEVDGGSGPSFLVYHNFRTLMVWNRSTHFALSVGLLSDLLRES
ncbi:MAG: lytic murein transglycosylase [Geminicoccaceae bacterium]